MLEVSGISKRFGGLQAVDQISLSAAPGETLGLIGPNGSGKSTTLSLIMGVTRPDSGSIRIADQEVAGRRSHTIARQGAAMVFQHSRPLHRQTILENIKLALLPDSVFQLFMGRHIEEQAREVAHRVGLADVLHEYPSALPFAYLRRLEVARALASNPRILLFDEPFAGLAPSETREFADLIRAQRDAGCAVVLVDHNVKAVAELVDRIVVMDAGTKIAEGTPETVTNDEKVREVYFGKSLDGTGSSTSRKQDVQTKKLLSTNIESVHYDQARALGNIAIHVNEGEFVSVVGLNGAGKTTLFNAILGFVDYKGDIHWDGQSIRGRKPAAIARAGIALCPETRELFGQMSVRENLDMGGHALETLDRREQIDKVFELFPVLKKRVRQSAFTLSGGEQQMLTIARGLMQKPALLLLDEPTLGLAPLVMESISEALNKLQHESGLTVLLAEQNLTFAIRHSQRIYHLETGTLRWEGQADRFETEVGADIL